MPIEHTAHRPALGLRAARLVLVCLLTLAAVGAPTTARAQSAPPPPRLPRTVEDPAIERLPGAPTDAPAATPDLEAAQGDGGRIVYQSYQDGNWEIYSASSAPYSPSQRLTAEPSPDLEPKLNLAMTQVVFASRRTGNYEIFRVNSDGSGTTQLTNHGATDSSPAWSPDGQRIAFQSNRNGNDDVFVMNADGSGLAQLTGNADYDGEPTWSPDGKQLAFISRRSGGDVDYFLYVMNADGSAQRLLAPLPYSSRPSWSHDGTRLVLDAMSSSGWQRLYLVDVGSGQTRELSFFSGYTNTDVLSGAWGTGDNVFLTYAHYVQSNGQWYWDAMTIYAGDVAGGSLTPLSGDRMAFPGWANPDRLPPVTYVVPPTTPFVRSGQWIGIAAIQVDQGIGGVGWAEIQTRRAGEEWAYGGACTNAGGLSAQCNVMGFGPSAFQYRLRSRDGFGNVEPWPEDSARWGVLLSYMRLYLGSVRDQRGTPLALVPVHGLSTYETDLATDASGQWLAHETNFNWPTAVTVTVDGMTLTRSAAEFNPLPNGDVRIDFVVPAADNVLVNPGFETPGLGWTPAAGTAFSWLSASETQSGSAGLRLVWGPGGAAVLDVASTATAVVSGTTTLIAHRNATGNVLSFCPPTGICATESLGNTDTRDLAVRSDGTVAVIVDNGDGTRSFRQRSPTGVWSSAEPFPYMGTGLGHRLLADGTGRWHAVWAEGDGMVHIAHREDDGSWPAASQAGLMQKGFDAVIDGSDVIHMVGCPTSGVIEVTWSPLVGMSLPVAVSSETCDTPHLGTSLDGAGHIDTVWATSGVVRFSRRAPDGTWGAPVPAVGAASQAQSISLGPQGRATVLVSNAVDGVFLLQTGADGASWEHLTPTLSPLSAATARAVLAFNWAGQRKMILRETFATYEVWNNRVAVYDFDADRTHIAATQLVTLPAGLHRPLLSVDYRFTPVSADDTLALSIQGVGEGAPTLFSLPAGSGWQRPGFDVSAWVGQTVTVAIVVTDAGAETAPIAELNDINLGSWYTPVVNGIAPRQWPTSSGTLVITGDNFVSPTVTVGGQPAAVTVIDGQHLSVTLPAGLPLGRASVFVSNRGAWTVRAPDSVQIGSTLVFVPQLMRWSPPGFP